MTDESIEGWAVMLSRNPQQRRKMELKYSAANTFRGQQSELAPTAWRASPAASGTEDSEPDGGGSSFRGGRGRGRGRGRGGGSRGGGGNVAGPTGDKATEQARRRKEASKGSRANHNRRDQRAKKMARGGFPA
jgi:activating signal cointegrator complex subunit 2